MLRVSLKAVLLPLLLAVVLLGISSPPASAGTIDRLTFTPAGADANQNAWLYVATVSASGLSNDCANQDEDLADGRIVNADRTFDRGLGFTTARGPACPAYGVSTTQSLTGLSVIGLPPDQTFTASLALRVFNRFQGLGGSTLTFGPITRPISTPPLVCAVHLVTAPGALRSVAEGTVEIEVEALTTIGAFPCAGYFADVVLVSHPPGAQGAAIVGATFQQLDGLGRASIRVHLGTLDGTYTIRVGCSRCGVPSVQPLEIPIEAGAKKVLRLEQVATTDGQRGPLARPLPQPLQVRVTEDGRPKAGVAITWQVTGGPAGAAGQAASPASTPTGQDGTAQTTVTLGTRPGLYTITATCAGCTEGSPVTFTATALACSGLSVSVFDSPRPIGTAAPDTASKTTVTATVAEPAPTGGCAVVFAQPVPVAQSGGHAHDDPARPHGQITPETCTILEGMTFCVTSYASSEVAGEEAIRATLRDTGETAVGFVSVQVRDLEPLVAQTFLKLEPSTKHGFLNHFGTATMVKKVLDLAHAYHAQTNTTLRISNMSLPQGGLFDISGTWQPPHKSHREGRNVDISRYVAGTLAAVKQDLLNRIATEQVKGLIRRTEGADECPVQQPGQPPCIHFTLSVP